NQYSSTHTYFSLSHTFLDTTKENESIFVGTHTYQYKFTLPLTCDSTYQKGYGKIKYGCLIDIVRPFPKSNIQLLEQFTVVRPVDLRIYHIPAPQIETVETRYLPSSKGSVTMKAILHDGWYLPGQTIHFDASIFNRSHSPISSMEVRLVEATTYLGFQGYKRHQRVVKNELVNTCQEIYVASGGDYDCKRAITIPPFTPTIHTCPHIIVEYYVKVLVSTSSSGTSLSLRIPIVIGT
ncbi:hypothetical protein PENTCL1PPCAC_15267, partial [Pristionchus entomophagus]